MLGQGFFIFMIGLVLLAIILQILVLCKGFFYDLPARKRWYSTAEAANFAAVHECNEAIRSGARGYRGHDMIASYWKMNNANFSILDAAICAAAATSIQNHDGFSYDGKAIKDGLLTEQDFEDYFSWLDDIAPIEDRYNAFFGESTFYLAALEYRYNKRKEMTLMNLRNVVSPKTIRDARFRSMAIAFEEFSKDHYLKEFSK